MEQDEQSEHSADEEESTDRLNELDEKLARVAELQHGAFNRAVTDEQSGGMVLCQQVLDRARRTAA